MHLIRYVVNQYIMNSNWETWDADFDKTAPRNVQLHGKWLLGADWDAPH